MTTIEKNKMIAEFMGGKEVDWFSGRVIIMPFKEGLTVHNYLHHAKGYMLSTEIKYDRSFDWIMAVISKIESLGFWFRTQSANKGKHHIVKIGRTAHDEHIHVGKTANAIDVYNEAVIQFIQWHREQPTTNKN